MDTETTPPVWTAVNAEAESQPDLSTLARRRRAARHAGRLRSSERSPRRRRGHRWFSAAGMGLLIGMAASAVVLVAWLVTHDGAKASRFTGRQLDPAQILAAVGPSVVSVQVGDVRNADVFGGSGTGFVIDSDGTILTNAHVVNGAQRIKVVFGDGSQRLAELVGSIPDRDVAVIRLKERPPRLRPVEFGSSDAVVVGDDVAVVGNALNLGSAPSMTVGIVSALNRSISAPNTSLTGLIQTDAAINPGNSGGPLLDSRGRVIGVVTAVAVDGQNIGFAIGSDEILPLIDDIEAGNSTINPGTAFLGVRSVSMGDLSPEVRAGLDAEQGAVIVRVVPDSPASKAGLIENDVVVAVDSVEIATPDDLGQIVRSHKPGEELRLTVSSGGRMRTVTAKLGRTGG